MTNKELFKQLSKEQQMEIVQTLVAYKNVHIEYYNGQYHITTAYTLQAKYPHDYKVLNEYSHDEFYKDIPCDYHNDWYDFWNKKEAKGEKNEIIIDEKGEHHGKWQLEFEKSYMPIYEKALQNYLEA